MDINVNEIDLMKNENELAMILAELDSAEINAEIDAIASEALEEERKTQIESVEIKTVEPKKAKKPRKPRVTLAKNKDERIMNALGGEIEKYSILEVGETSSKEMLLERLKEAPSKIANRVTFFMEYVSGRSAELNNIAKIAMKCLVKDGYVSASPSVKNQGNVYKALIDYPYVPSSASAMGANTVKAMQLLKIVTPDDNGKLIANPKSTYLEILKDKLKL